MRITSDGKAILCSADWDHHLVIGDLKKKSVKEVWDSEALLDYQLKFLKGERKDLPACSECEMFRYTQLVHLDPYRKEILERIQDTKK
jgi:radical SAM protein with 4Fe4S-binding SPASM domain